MRTVKATWKMSGCKSCGCASFLLIFQRDYPDRNDRLSKRLSLRCSGVAVSCGECSSSGTSDITEPGSPCSTSSDEGVAIRGTSASPLPSLPKLAASSQVGTRPQWPWTPPLAATACSTYKRLRGEPEAGALARSGAAADPTSRGAAKGNGKAAGGQHHHESQGKITEYFKTQIKPQQPKVGIRPGQRTWRWSKWRNVRGNKCTGRK